MLRCFTGKRKGDMADLDTGAASGTATPDEEPNEQLKSLEAQGLFGRAPDASVDSETLTPTTPVTREVKPAWERPAASRLGQSEASTTERSDARYRLRWAVNIKQWNPWDDEWLFLLDLLPEEDQKEVRRFDFGLEVAWLATLPISGAAHSTVVYKYYHATFSWLLPRCFCICTQLSRCE